MRRDVLGREVPSSAVAPAARESGGEVAGIRAIGATLREQAPLFTLLAIYLVARLLWTGGEWPIDGRAAKALAPAFGAVAVLVLPIVAIAYAFRVTARSPGEFAAFRPAAWLAFRREYLGAGRLTAVALAVVFLSLWLPLFLHWKADIGTSPAFSWDERFMRWDRALHLGRHPWEWLHPLLGRPGVTRVIDTLYHPVWNVGIAPGVLMLAAWSGRRALALRFWVSYALIWMVIGTGLAYMFASAGPVFYGPVVEPATDPYANLVSYLASVHAEHGLASMGAAQILWDGYTTQAWPRVGISAMPSVHVAVAALVVILGFRVHRVWGVLALLYLAIVQVGSFHLAWHYAIDGYLSMALVPLLWWLGGRWVGWWSGGRGPG